MAERQAQRRFTALKVGEVSLVDSPANEEEFIVLKRRDQEENTMADTKKNETPAPAATTSVTKGSDTPEVVSVEVAKAQDEGAKAALATVEKLVSDIAKMVSAAPADADVEKVKKDKAAEMRKKLADAGMKGKALEKAMDAYAAEGDDADEVEAKKAAAEDGEAAIAKTLEALATSIHKAKSFTPKREKALKGAVEELQKLLSEITQVPMATMPANTLPGATQVDSGLFDIKKTLDDLVGVLKSSFGNVEVSNKGLSDRIEAIEKARNPSQSETPTGGTDKKVQKSFWGGVL